MIFVVCAAYESRTFRTRTRCCTTRGGRRSIFRDVNSESVCIDGVDTLAHVIKVLTVRGFGILDRTFIVSWSLSIALHASLHTSQDLPVPEQGAVLPEAGVVCFFGMSLLRVLVLMGLIHWLML